MDYLNDRKIGFDDEHIWNLMKVFTDNDSPSFWEFIVNISVELLISLELAIIHGFDKSGRSTQKCLNASIFHGRHNLSCQWTKWISEVFVLILWIFLILILIFICCSLSFNLGFLFFLLSILFIFLLGRYHFCFGNVFKDEYHSNHRFTAQRSWGTCQIKSESDRVLKFRNRQFILVKDFLDVFRYLEAILVWKLFDLVHDFVIKWIFSIHLSKN